MARATNSRKSIGQSASETASANSWLEHTSLRLHILINLARGVADDDWPPPKVPDTNGVNWLARFYVIKAFAIAKKLKVSLPEHDQRYMLAFVEIADLVAFLKARTRARSLDWLRDFCERWATFHEANQNATGQLSTKDRRELKVQVRLAFAQRVKSWNRSGPFPNADEDRKAMEKAVGQSIPRSMARNIRREVCKTHQYDDTNWLKRGQRRRRPAPAE